MGRLPQGEAADKEADRKSTRLNSSHLVTSYAVFCLKKKQSEKLGAVMHVGQPEYAAGKGAGERAKAAGVKSFLCVNHYATNPASFDRCRGFGDAIGADYKKSTLDSGDDPTTIEAKVAAYLRQNPATNGVLTLGPTSASPTIKALEKSGQAGKVWMATFDLSDDSSQGIKGG